MTQNVKCISFQNLSVVYLLFPLLYSKQLIEHYTLLFTLFDYTVGTATHPNINNIEKSSVVVTMKKGPIKYHHNLDTISQSPTVTNGSSRPYQFLPPNHPPILFSSWNVHLKGWGEGKWSLLAASSWIVKDADQRDCVEAYLRHSTQPAYNTVQSTNHS